MYASASIGVRSHARMRGSASASIVPSTHATTAFPSAMRTLSFSALGDLGRLERDLEPLRREALPVEDVAAAVEGEHDDDRDRRVEEDVREDRVAAEEPTPGHRVLLLLARARARRRRARRQRADDHHRDRRAERPVAGLEELLGDEIAGVERLVAAEDHRDDVLARQRDEDEERACEDARKRERQRDPPERTPAAGRRGPAPRRRATSRSARAPRRAAAPSAAGSCRQRRCRPRSA